MVGEQTASMEDYLEAIANLREQGKVVRVKQISEMLKVKMPSVTAALKRLSEKGLVVHDSYGYVELTPAGSRIAEDVVHRHKTLSHFFARALDIDLETAEEDACKVEHVISPLTLERVLKFLEFIEACPLGETNFQKRYKYYLEHGELPEECLARGLEKK
jgi:DtxR family Mn-dependent transcriptional regulator